MLPCAGLALLLSACTTAQPISRPQLQQCSAIRIDQKTPSTGKTFAIDHAWHTDGWCMKQGGMISFQPDGTGIIEATLYDTVPTGKAERIHLYIHAYGKDGNALFTLPNADAGHVLHVHGVRQDCIHTLPFAYDARYFSSIEKIRFSAGRDAPLGLATSGK